MTDNTTFLGFDKKQIPILSLLLAGFIMLAGMFYQLNSNINSFRAETNANINALNSRVDALHAAMNANDNALRSETSADINALDSRIDALTVQAAETNARTVNIESRIENIERRVENIERNLPAYASVDIRLAELEREQARIAELEREQARLSELVADLVNAE